MKDRLIIRSNKNNIVLYPSDKPSSVKIHYSGLLHTDYHGPILEIYESDAGRYYKHKGRLWRMLVVEEEVA